MNVAKEEPFPPVVPMTVSISTMDAYTERNSHIRCKHKAVSKEENSSPRYYPGKALQNNGYGSLWKW